MTFNPYDWYWLADDGSIFASARETIVDETDADYLEWTGAGNTPTLWPRDDAGNQTTAALQEVLTPYNLWVDLYAYAANVRYNHASGGVIVTSLGGSVPFLSDSQSRNMVNSAFDFLTLKGAGATVHWKLSDGTFVVLDVAQITTLMDDMATFVQACFGEESTLVAGIAGGTITTQAQIDAAFAAISNVFP
jgi:hypothetical protein